jgi:hypothetical protein
MQVQNGRFMYSATDLNNYLECGISFRSSAAWRWANYAGPSATPRSR